MSVVKIDKSRAVSFTGHRILPRDFSAEEVEKAVYKAINDNFDTFLVGMAIGFDSLCFRVLEGVRLNKDIKIIACVPCSDQSEFFNKKQKKEYDRMIKEADEVITLGEKYQSGCMQKRNAFMIDNSSRLIAYLRIKGGGTYSTVKYAVEQGLEIEYIK